VAASSAATNCTSAPSQFTITRSFQRIGVLPGPFMWSRRSSRLAHAIRPVAVSTQAVPKSPKWQYSRPPASTGDGEAKELSAWIGCGSSIVNSSTS